MHPYPSWMTGDQMAAVAEREYEAHDDEYAASVARKMLDDGDWSLTWAEIGCSIGEVVSGLMGDDYFLAQENAMGSMLAGNFLQAKPYLDAARQMLLEKLESLISRR